jgi:hypothetical protein
MEKGDNNPKGNISCNDTGTFFSYRRGSHVILMRDYILSFQEAEKRSQETAGKSLITIQEKRIALRSCHEHKSYFLPFPNF